MAASGGDPQLFFGFGGKIAARVVAREQAEPLAIVVATARGVSIVSCFTPDT